MHNVLSRTTRATTAERKNARASIGNLAALRTELVTRREREREREREIYFHKKVNRERHGLLEFTRFDACLRVSPTLFANVRWKIYPLGTGLPDSGQVGWPVDRRRRRRRAPRVSFEGTGRSRSIVTVRYSTFFGCLYRGLDARELLDTATYVSRPPRVL